VYFKVTAYKKYSVVRIKIEFVEDFPLLITSAKFNGNLSSNFRIETYRERDVHRINYLMCFVRELLKVTGFVDFIHCSEFYINRKYNF
jgi:hypothetical protein